MKKPTGIILAGMHSSSGKTTVACLVLAALRQRGLLPQPFKVGPDFIDPGFHAAMAGVLSRNLDSWLTEREVILEEVSRAVDSGSIPVIEGVMGLFDGSDPASDAGSTLELARELNWPVVLVVPCAKAARSLAAAVRGFMDAAGQGRIAALILNQVGSESHADYLRTALAPLELPIIGVIPKRSELAWPERHLGLQSSTEFKLPDWTEMAALAEEHLDVGALLATVAIPNAAPRQRPRQRAAKKIRLGIAQDEAFHFYYPANIEFLEEAGAELVFFSPLHDSKLPDLDAVLIGGGFPEIFAERLAENRPFRESLRTALERGLPGYAECGGFIYLAEKLITLEGREFPMVGVIPGIVEMTPRLQNFGYCEGLHEGKNYRGHEFHHSRWRQEGEQANLWTVRRHRTGAERTEGFTAHHFHASYIHLDYRSSRDLILPRLGLESVVVEGPASLQEALA